MAYVLSRFKIRKGKRKKVGVFLQELQRDHQKEMIEVLREAAMTLGWAKERLEEGEDLQPIAVFARDVESM